MTSRRELYAHGEPFGDSCTSRKIDGKGYVCGFGGDSSSASTTNNTSVTQDNRVAVQGGVGLSNSSGNVINVTDGGIVGKALDTMGFVIGGTVGRALDTVDFAIGSNNQVVNASLGASTNAFNKALEAAQASSQAASEAAQAAAEQSARASRDALSFADGQIGRALETVDATLGEGFGRLMDISENLFSAGGDLVAQTQSTVANAYTDAANTAKGTIDNRTMIVLAVAAAGSIVAIMYFKKR